MQRRLYRSKCSLFILGLFILIAALAYSEAFMPAYAMSLSAHRASRTAQQVGGSQPLLVVLLDRSGSLTYGPGATDPNGYSTSVTKALADLWPGDMAVIPFSGDATPVLGPYPMSQRDQLKQQVQNYPIGGNTPLAPALHKALDLLKNAPSGSKVVIVTDGSPEPPVMANGVNQSDDIRHNLIHQFALQGIPISAFGLSLDLTQPDGQTADKLLRDIATGTSGTYTNVRSAPELARVVMQLYADWQHLVFEHAQGSDTYPVPIDTYAKKVIFVSFRSDSQYAIGVSGPSGQPLPSQSVQSTTDRHYEIDSLVLSNVNQPGTYTVRINGDSNAQVYALVETRLHAALLKPTAQTIAYIGQPLTIQAELLEDAMPIIPKANEATMNANITLLPGGQPLSVELAQVAGSPVFSGTIKLPGPPGQVHIQVEAVYLQIPVEASQAQVTIRLQKFIPPPPPPPPPPICGFDIKCYWQHYPAEVMAAIGISLALLLALLLFLLLRKGPIHGTLTQSGITQELHDLRGMVRKSVVSSGKLEANGFNFNGARFDLVFSQGSAVVKGASDTPRISVKSGSRIMPATGDGVDLMDKDIIQVAGCAPATYRDEV